MTHAADCIMAYEAGQNKSYINYVTNERLEPHQLAAVEVLNNRRIIYSNSNIPLGICAFHEKQRPMVYRAHIYFCSKAKNCMEWCSLKNPNLPLLPNSRAYSHARSTSENS